MNPAPLKKSLFSPPHCLQLRFSRIRGPAKFKVEKKEKQLDFKYAVIATHYSKRNILKP